MQELLLMKVSKESFHFFLLTFDIMKTMHLI